MALLVGVDGSEPSLQALDWAAGEATLRGAGLTVLGVANDDLLTEPALWTTPQLIKEHAADVVERAADRARRAAPTVPVSTRVVVGAATEELEKAAREADLLVLGCRGLGAFLGLLLGSVFDADHGRSAGSQPVRREVVAASITVLTCSPRRGCVRRGRRAAAACW